MPDFSDFHFLRPGWLLGLVPAIALFVSIRWRLDPERQWRGLIAPHLLSHLKVGGVGGSHFQPIHLVTVALVLGSLGLAAPSWEREISPFAEDTAPLVIALDVSRSMNAIDVQPTRLERAKQKIRDLLVLREGSKTALIAYSGSAHTVLPLSDDTAIFETFLASLATDMMPTAGKDPVGALDLAVQLLERDSVPGSIIFLTDGIGSEHAGRFVSHRDNSDAEIMVLALGTTTGGPIRSEGNTFVTDSRGRRLIATLDKEGLDQVAAAADVFVVGATVGDADVNRVQRRVQSHLNQVREEDDTSRWRDDGYYFAYPVAFLVLLWFRRGWTVRWGFVVLVFTVSGCTGSSRGPSRFADLWLTPDQQGRYHFERDSYAVAAERFDDPMWKGVAFVRARDLDGALESFAMVDTPESNFNLGNVFARLGNYAQALASYDAALERIPDWREALENRELIATLIESIGEQEEDSDAPTGQPSLDADEVVFDERGGEGEVGEVEQSVLSDEEIAEMWMRRLNTSPTDFLRARFLSEVAERRETGVSP